MICNDSTNISMNRSIYEKFLDPRKEVNHQLMKLLTKTDIMNAGRLLGVVKENSLYLNDNEMPCICDIAFREPTRNGTSPIEQMFATGNIREQFQREYLAGLRSPRISLFEVSECHPEAGWQKLHDLLFPAQGDIQLYDISFSSIASCGKLLFTTAIPVYDAYLTSGILFAFELRWKDFILREVHKGFGQQWENPVKRFKLFFHLNRKIGNQAVFR